MVQAPHSHVQTRPRAAAATRTDAERLVHCAVVAVARGEDVVHLAGTGKWNGIGGLEVAIGLVAVVFGVVELRAHAPAASGRIGRTAAIRLDAGF